MDGNWRTKTMPHIDRKRRFYRMNIEITYNEAKQILSSLHETENTLFGFTSSWRVNAKIEMIDGIKKKIYDEMNKQKEK